MVRAFLTNRSNASVFFHTIKTQRSYKEAKRLIQRLRPFRVNNHVYGDMVIRRWDDVLTIPITAQSADWVQEFGWLAHGFRHKAKEINKYLTKRKEFGKTYLLGQYEDAEKILDEVENEFGYSLWLVERQLMVQQALTEFKGNKELLGKIQAEAGNNIVGFIATKISDKFEEHVNYLSSQSSVNSILENLAQEGLITLSDLIEIQVSPWTHNWLARGQSMLLGCLGRPLIDRYETAVKVVSHLLCGEITELQQSELKEIVTDLCSCIDDGQLQRIAKNVLDLDVPDADGAFDKKSAAYLQALDNFAVGNYEECTQLAISLLQEDPSSFDFYWLLARALSCSTSEQPIDIAEDSLAFIILNALQTIAENKSDLNLILVGLKNAAYKLGSNHLGLSLWQFAERELTKDLNKEACRYASIQSKICSPEPTINEDEIYQRHCINDLERRFGEHLCLDIERFRLDPRNANPASIKAASSCLNRVVLAEKLSEQQDFAAVLDQIAPIIRGRLSQSPEAKYYSRTAAALEFNALLELNKPIEAASAVLEYYVLNKNLLRHLPFERLISGAKSGKWEELRSLIHYPVIVFLNNGPIQQIYMAADNVLRKHKQTSPLAFIENKIPCSKEALRILLRDVIIMRVIARGALWARTQKERRALRTKFLQYLYSMSIEDQGLIVEELSALDRAEKMDESYQEIEGPKFILDFTDINKYLAEVFEDFYERYRAFKDYEETGGQLIKESELLERVKSGATAKTEDDKKEPGRETNSDAILRQLATAIFGNYLFHPEKGFNATLRTRIIHGALENQLKRVLGAHNLLAAKDLAENYICDRSVTDRISECSVVEREKVESSYIEFSEKVAEIYADLIAKKFRIKIPENELQALEGGTSVTRELVSQEGVIDFYGLFSDNVIARLHELQSPSMSAFIAEVHKIFIEQCESTFRNVQHYVETDLSSRMYAALKILEDSVEDALDDGPLRVSLRKDIISARDEFAADLSVIKNWFSAATYGNFGEKSLSELIHNVFDVVDFATSSNKLGVLERGTCDPSIDLKTTFEYGMSMKDVLSILLRNVVQHSQIELGQVIHFDYTLEDDGCRHLTFKNKVASPDLCATLVDRACKSISKPGDPRVLDRSPGGTGLNRIRALLSPYSSHGVVMRVSQGLNDTDFEVEVTY